MSSIPKSKRSESKLEAIHKAYAIRSRITQELLLSFGYSQKKLECHVKKATAYIKDPDEREERAKTVKELEEEFFSWLIGEERSEVLRCCRGIVQHLTAANTIYPTYPAEFEERRLEMDRAMACCNQLQQELQYLAEDLPTDKNKYMNIALEVKSEFEMIKKLRQSDNRFLKHLKKL